MYQKECCSQTPVLCYINGNIIVTISPYVMQTYEEFGNSMVPERRGSNLKSINTEIYYTGK